MKQYFGHRRTLKKNTSNVENEFDGSKMSPKSWDEAMFTTL